MSISLALALSKHLGTEATVYWYHVNCYLLKRYLEDKLVNDEAAMQQYNRLMYILHESTVRMTQIYYCWCREFGIDIEKPLQEIGKIMEKY